MDMAFPESCGADADKRRLFSQLCNGSASSIPHACLESADELKNVGGKRTPVRHPSHDSFGNKLIVRFLLGLVIAVLAAFFHGFQRSHTAVHLIASTLEKNRFSWTFLGSGKKTADHHHMSAGADGFGYITGKLDAAVCNQRNTFAVADILAVHDRRHLRNAGAGHDARGTDGTGSDADLHPINSGYNEIIGAFFSGHISSNQLDMAEGLLQRYDRVHDIFGMTMRGIDQNDICTGLQEHFSAFQHVRSDTDGRPHAKPAFAVLAGIGIFPDFFDVFDGDHAGKFAVFIHDQQFFNPVFVKQFFGFIQIDAFGNRHQIFIGHHFGDASVQIRLKAKIPVGDNSDQTITVGYRNSGNMVFFHEIENVLNILIGPDGDRIDNHAAFGLFDLSDFKNLALDAHVAMNESQSSFSGHADGGLRFRDSIHGGTDDGDVQHQISRQPRGGCNIFGKHIRIAGYQQDIVE